MIICDVKNVPVVPRAFLRLLFICFNRVFKKMVLKISHGIKVEKLKAMIQEIGLKKIRYGFFVPGGRAMMVFTRHCLPFLK